jgi:hypothetical protein
MIFSPEYFESNSICFFVGILATFLSYKQIIIGNLTRDPELKAIISLILLAETVSNGAIITLKKLTFATALEGVDLWRGKVNTRSYAKIKTIGDLKEWLRCNLVGKLITVKRYGKNKVRVIDLLSKEEES